MNVEIDFDVFKELTRRRISEGVTYNDVLRELLKLSPQKKPVALADAASAQGGWTAKGVLFPEGTRFRATHKGQTHYGEVEAGALVVDNKRFESASSAAVGITGNPVNGWTFWECLMPGMSSWQMIKFLRK